jgi:uncharacterized membrane protein
MFYTEDKILMDYLASIHPQIVHFPVALLFSYTVLEITGAFFKKEFCTKMALLPLLFGTLGAVLASFTGNQAVQSFDSVLNTISTIHAQMLKASINDHQYWANLTTWFFIFVLILRTFFYTNVIRRKKLLKHYYKALIGFSILAMLGCLLIYQTGMKGGMLVYKYGIGTEIIKHYPYLLNN